MRTTLRLDPALLREARRIAVETGRTLTAVIDELLKEALLRRRRARRPGTRVSLPTFRGGGLQTGVDLDDSAGLLERMERGHADS